MSDFFRLVRRLIHDRAMLVTALAFALISAVTMGVGVLSLIPAIKLIVNEEGIASLPVLGRRFNDGGHLILGVPIRIPDWVIAAAPAGRFDGVILIMVTIAALTVVGACFNFLHQYLSITVATRTVARARLEIFRTAMYMGLLRAMRRGPSEFVARIANDTAAVQRGLISLMSKTIAHSTQGLAMFVVAVVAGRSLTLAAVVILPLFALVQRKIGKRIRRGTQGALSRQQVLLRIATESIQGLRAVKANTGEGEAIERFHAVNQDVVRQELRARIARAVSGPVVETIAVFAIGLLVILAARQIIDNGLTTDRFVISIGALAIAGSKFKMMAGLINEMQAASAPARRLLDVLDETRDDEETKARPSLPPHARSIRFQHVHLTYPGSDEPALDGIDLDIRHGQRIAIVGPNGSGKTTLLSLLPRLLVPDAGRVLVDDVDVATVSLESLRTQIAVVTQETVLFRGSIAANISFGTRGVSRRRIIDAAGRAHADEFIRQLPDGYDADVAEQGASLSGGQRQRIAIARAFLRDPSILILDEATSQIDAESEGHIGAAIAEFCRGRTVLLIAHRLATVLDADRTVVMERGRIVGQGRHEELLARCPLYRRLTQTQLISPAGPGSAPPRPLGPEAPEAPERTSATGGVAAS